MRLSAKFNIFLGVPNLTSEFFPEHLEHLKSYLPKRPMNALFPVSVVGSSLLAIYFFQGAQQAAIGSGAFIGFIVLCTLTTLALIEHAFMILPLPDAVLWRWAAPERPVDDTTSFGAALGDPAPVRASSPASRLHGAARTTKSRPIVTATKD
jgi:Protein of unknown function (DUF3623)